MRPLVPGVKLYDNWYERQEGNSNHTKSHKGVSVGYLVNTYRLHWRDSHDMMKCSKIRLLTSEITVNGCYMIIIDTLWRIGLSIAAELSISLLEKTYSWPLWKWDEVTYMMKLSLICSCVTCPDSSVPRSSRACVMPFYNRIILWPG